MIASASVVGFGGLFRSSERSIHIAGIRNPTGTEIPGQVTPRNRDWRFDALPGGVYNISYIRQFARAIGADETPLLQLYRASYSSAA
jgi:hypothetical protein